MIGIAYRALESVWYLWSEMYWLDVQYGTDLEIQRFMNHGGWKLLQGE